MSPPPPGVRVAVVPPAEYAHRARVLTALGDAEGATFEPREPGCWQDADLVLACGSEGAAALRERPPRRPSLLLHGGRAGRDDARTVSVGDDAQLERVLHGARLSERSAGVVEAGGGDGTTLAATEEGPVWVRGPGDAHVVAAELEELTGEDALRERLEPGRCLAVLALTHLLRRVAGPRGWAVPAPRACFILDDPNLHWGTYGHVHYRRLLAHAVAHRYHMVIAMVPLDGWFAHPGVVRRFRAAAEHVSIAVHGNDHLGPELGALDDPEAGLAVAAQALRRTWAFERRTGLPVSRVMVPPHERASHAAVQAIRDTGFEGLCTTRPYPWLATRVEQPWLTRPAVVGPSVGWGPAEVVAGGVPTVLRVDFQHPFEEVVLRAFLGQPSILYGHHDALRDDLDMLGRRAALVNGLGDVRWGSLGDVMARSATTRRDGDVLEVRMLARRVVVDVPAGVTELRADASVFGPDAALRGADPSAGDTVAVTGPGPVTLQLAGPAAPEVPAPPRRLWPIARRVAGESRDRLQPLRRR
jgi:hypothetical protein